MALPSNFRLHLMYQQQLTKYLSPSTSLRLRRNSDLANHRIAMCLHPIKLSVPKGIELTTKENVKVLEKPPTCAELTPEDIVKVLEATGWEAKIVRQSDVNDLVKVGSNGLFKCVDGRPSTHPGMNGPKALGGVYAIASNRGVTSIEGLKRIVEEVKEAGFVPSVHGDNCASPAPMGCGFFKLWSSGKLLGIPPPKFDSEEGMEAVLEAGGAYEKLIGAHEESVVMINFVPNTTLEPKAGDQRFVVDAWVAGEFSQAMTVASPTTSVQGPSYIFTRQKDVKGDVKKHSDGIRSQLMGIFDHL